jgi:hypothetical protein
MWSVPKLWPGGTVAVMASGPGMTQKVADEVYAAGVPAIVVNSTYRLAPWAQMLYAADPEWWLYESNRTALKFPGLRVSCQPVAGVHQLRNSGIHGFDPDPACVRTGGNSGYQALHVAAHAGAARVLLCGFDMQETRGEAHWHGKHPHGLRNTPAETYARWRDRFAAMAPILAERGVDVVTVTPSALTCFRSGDLQTELCAGR